MRKVLQTIVRDTERYSISNSSELSLSKPDLYIEKIALQGGETAITDDIVVTRSGKNLFDVGTQYQDQWYSRAGEIQKSFSIFEDNISFTLLLSGMSYAIREKNIDVSNVSKIHFKYDYVAENTVASDIRYRTVIKYYDKSGEQITDNSVDGTYNTWYGAHYKVGKDITINISSSVGYINIGVIVFTLNSEDEGKTVTISNIQLEYGDTATEYEPYLPPKSLTFSRDYLLSLKGANNLLDKSKFPVTQTINGITYTNNGDGTITVGSGTATRESYLRVYECTDLMKATYGHKFAIFGGTAYKETTEAGTKTTLYFRLEINKQVTLGGADWSGKGGIFTNNKIATDSINYSYALIHSVKSGKTIPKLVFKPALYDLTSIYGEGNEPTTVEQFLKAYPLSSADKLTITKNSVKYNDTDITSEVVGLDEFFSIDADVSTITTGANIALGEITEDISYSVKSNKRAVYTGEDVIYSSQTFIMSDIVTTTYNAKGKVFLTKSQFDTRKAAGTLQAGTEYMIIDKG